jgi:hypothetical protein
MIIIKFCQRDLPTGYVYAYGSSQGGRFLRHFIYLGLNRDEQGQRAFDGILPKVAGARRGEFNHRFAQPSHHMGVDPGHLAPFSTSDMLARQLEMGHMPNIMLCNSAAEYWRGDGSLEHISTAGDIDLPEPPNCRSYLFASTQHGPGSGAESHVPPLTGVSGDRGFVGQHGKNVVDYTPLLRVRAQCCVPAAWCLAEYVHVEQHRRPCET